MKIALCDDEKFVLEEFSSLIKKFSTQNQIGIELLYFAKPSELFHYMQNDTIDLIFMDLEFGDEAEDGIAWTGTIKKHFPGAFVIILTAYEKRYKEGYEVKAFRFMSKPVREEELFAYLHVSMEEMQLTKSISLVRRGIPHSIFVKDICYLSAQSGGSELWTRTDIYYCDESLLQWEQQLPMDIFFRCHSKYLVNMSNITKYDKQILTLVNGEKIPVSRRKWKAFQLAYMKFDTKNFN